MIFSRSLFRPPALFVAFGFVLAAAQAQVNVQVGQNFKGSGNSQTYITPADGNGAVGPKHFAEFINGAFAVYNKTNGARVVRITDMKFWSNGGPGGSGNGISFGSSDAVSDPRVIYDPVSQRWFASQVDYDGSVSDPTLESDYISSAFPTPPTRPACGRYIRSLPTRNRAISRISRRSAWMATPFISRATCFTASSMIRWELR